MKTPTEVVGGMGNEEQRVYRPIEHPQDSCPLLEQLLLQSLYFWSFVDFSQTLFQTEQIKLQYTMSINICLVPKRTSHCNCGWLCSWKPYGVYVWVYERRQVGEWVWMLILRTLSQIELQSHPILSGQTNTSLNWNLK